MEQSHSTEEKPASSVNAGLMLDLFDPAVSHDRRVKPEHHHFINLLLQGVNRTDAFLQAFPRYKGKSANSIASCACRLLARPYIRQALELGYQQMRARAVWERWQSIDALAAIARARRGLPDAVPAIKELNAMQGYTDPQQVQVEFVQGVTRRIIDNGA